MGCSLSDWKTSVLGLGSKLCRKSVSETSTNGSHTCCRTSRPDTKSTTCSFVRQLMARLSQLATSIFSASRYLLPPHGSPPLFLEEALLSSPSPFLPLYKKRI